MLNLPETITNAQLVELYNKGLLLLGKSEEDFQKKFRDRATAEKRLTKLQEELLNMHGIAELKSQDDVLEWVTEKPKTNGKPAATEEEQPRTSRTNLPVGLPLTVLHESNPKRMGSRAHETFEIYRDESVKTGEDFVKVMMEKGYPRKLAMSTLHWDIDHGYVALGVVKETPLHLQEHVEIKVPQQEEAELEEEVEDTEASEDEIHEDDDGEDEEE